jgi:signal transduction histidine kinase
MTPDDEPDADERLRTLVHDLRTPLTIITGFLELIERQRDRAEPEQIAEYQRRIKAAADEMVEILDAERSERLAREL